MYLLLDANVTAGYYLPHSLDYKRAADRIQTIFDSIRSKGSTHFLYLPNFCVAEVFGVFAKHCYGSWNSDVKRKGGTIDSRVYKSLCSQFEDDIHNAKLIYHLELSRYHVLAVDLVSPIDHYFKLGKEKKIKGNQKRKKKPPRPAGTFDQLIVAMGIHLAHIHGQENVRILSCDHRLVKLVNKCRQDIPAKTVRKLKLDRADDIAGKKFSPDLFPKAMHLGTCSIRELKDTFGQWPLDAAKHKRAYRHVR